MFNGTGGSMNISTENGDASATLAMSLETFQKLRSKEINFMEAMGQQLVKIEGDMSVLMGFQAIMQKMQMDAEA